MPRFYDKRDYALWWVAKTIFHTRVLQTHVIFSVKMDKKRLYAIAKKFPLLVRVIFDVTDYSYTGYGKHLDV